MMRITAKNFLLYLAAFVLAGCAEDDLPTADAGQAAGIRELSGIEAFIEGNTDAAGVTRAGTVTPLIDYVGRRDFVSGDKAVFTEIRRTETPFDAFTYPGAGYDKDGDGDLDPYDGIIFNAGSEGGWTRDADDGGPERIYWTDAVNPHTFIAYSIPQSYGEFWKPYKFTQTEEGKTVTKTYYIGSIGDPNKPGLGQTTGDEKPDSIDFTPDGVDTARVNNVLQYYNKKLEHEDVVIAYDEELLAEPGGSVALVKFYHALSSIRVIVNISGFSASSEAADNNAVVSNMRLLHQPTMYVWMQANAEAQPLRASREGATVTDQQMVNMAYKGNKDESGPDFDQRKNIKLWIPRPEGSGSKQSKTFTFYGITTPQPQDYMTTLKDAGDQVNTKTQLSFDVTYPNPLNPSTTVTRPYTATIDDVYYRAGYNTTINISLNHKNEEMTVGAEYESWQFVSTPDQSTLRKNSTFLQDTTRYVTVAGKEIQMVTLVGEPNATADDATWLYDTGETDTDGNPIIKDIYGHTGNSVTDAYQISTAYQLVSFAYEVKHGNNGEGRDFKGKYVRLDADLTLQATSAKTKEEVVIVEGNTEEYNSSDTPWAIDWMGIGDATHAFNGTFLGGNRYIYRLKGSPLFVSLGKDAKIEQLNVSAIVIGNEQEQTAKAAVSGGGLFAETNAGLICASQVLDNISLSAETAGAFVGQNTADGRIYCCYHIGTTQGTANVGGLVGRNEGIISCSFQAGVVNGTAIKRGIAAEHDEHTGTIYSTYFNKSLFNYDSPSSNVTPKTTAEMTKQQFVDDLNKGIRIWRSSTDTVIETEEGGEEGETVEIKGLGHTGYDDHVFVYQPAHYPKLKE